MNDLLKKKNFCPLRNENNIYSPLSNKKTDKIENLFDINSNKMSNTDEWSLRKNSCFIKDFKNISPEKYDFPEIEKRIKSSGHANNSSIGEIKDLVMKENKEINDFLTRKTKELTEKYLKGDSDNEFFNKNKNESETESQIESKNAISFRKTNESFRKRTINLYKKKDKNTELNTSKEKTIKQESIEKILQSELILKSLNSKKKNLKETIISKNILSKNKPLDLETIEYVLKSKYTINHIKNMEEYLKKSLLPPETKVFCCNSQDEHIKRALLKNGWHENKNPNSWYFDLKWIYTDSDNDYKYLLDGQYYNHFLNNKELTTKISLSNNLKNYCEYGCVFDQFYPRCYDLSNSKEMMEFIHDFEHTNLMILLKKHIKYFKLKKPELFTLINHNIDNKKKTQKKIKKRNPKNFEKFYDFYSKEEDKNFVVNLSLIEIAVLYYASLSKQMKDLIEEGKCYEISNIDKKYKKDLMIYSQMDIPYENYNHDDQKRFSAFNEKWKTPNEKLFYLMIKYYKIFKKFNPQFKIDGFKNLWIIKPGGNSRGSGVHLINNLSEAIESSQSMKSRIIQKYIENPLIIQKSLKIQFLNNKKFDLRQWVLVKSFNPLIIYMFSSCYLRICGLDFNLTDLTSPFRHFSNFSLNKLLFQSKNISFDESVCPLESLKEILNENYSINWDEIIKPKIISLIIKSLKCVQDSIEQKGMCFELYGFDIMLDNDFIPWLLEVNLSPACAERTEWLTKMLDEMSEGLLKIVLPINYFNSNNNNHNNDYQWELIFNEKESNKEFWIPNNAVNSKKLEIDGIKVNIKKEKNLDQKYYKYM